MRRQSKTRWVYSVAVPWICMVMAPWALSVGVLVSFTAVAGQDSTGDWNVAPLAARLQTTNDAAQASPARFGEAANGDFSHSGQGRALLQTVRLMVGQPEDMRSIPDEREPHVDLKPDMQNFPEVDRTHKGDPVVAMRPGFETRRRQTPAMLGVVEPAGRSPRINRASEIPLTPRAETHVDEARPNHPAFGQNRPNADKAIDSNSVERALSAKPASTFSQPAHEAETARDDSLATTQKSRAAASPTQNPTSSTTPPNDSRDTVNEVLTERALHGASPGVSRAVALSSSTPAQPDALPIEVSSFPRATLALSTPGKSDNSAGRPDYGALVDHDRLDREKRCLAEAVYFESRSEPETGQAAVAQVVLNRVQSGLYPSSICGVVYQNRHRYKACQFSFACEGKSLRITERESWERAVHIASEVMDGRTYNADVGQSTHYHATYVRPRWSRALTKMDAIGRHIFYRLKPGQT